MNQFLKLLLTVLPIVGFSQMNPKSLQKITNIETSYPSWSPDGELIVFQSNRNDDNSEIYLMSHTGKNIKRLTYNMGNDEYPNISPDGRKITFVSEKDGNQEVYLMDTDGRNQVNITMSPSKDIHPQFSPDGKFILFNSDRKGNMDLYTYEMQGGALIQLTSSPFNDTYAQWSPKGDQIVYAKWLKDENGKNNTEIFLLDLHGGQEKRLTTDSGFDGWPSWSDDGSKIIFGSNRHDKKTFQIHMMEIDGSNVVKLTNGETDASSFTKPIFAKDGTGRVVCTRTKDGNVEIFVFKLVE